MAFSSFGLLASEVTTILAAKYPHIFSVNIILVGAVVDGICGSFLLGMALSYSYAADSTSPARRAMAFGYFQGCLFLGVAVGPAIGGAIIETTGNVLNVFYAALVGHSVLNGAGNIGSDHLSCRVPMRFLSCICSLFYPRACQSDVWQLRDKNMSCGSPVVMGWAKIIWKVCIL